MTFFGLLACDSSDTENSVKNEKLLGSRRSAKYFSLNLLNDELCVIDRK